MFGWFSNLRLRWKVLLAPAFLILVLIAVGSYALYVQRANQAAVDALMVGPVAQAETVADFSTAIWTAHARLYGLTATAANESDEKKIKAVAGRTATNLAALTDKLKALDSLTATDPKTAAALDKLKTSVAAYLKQAKSVIDMSDSDAGSALMFMMGAERSFVEIEKLTSDMTEATKDVRDLEIARADAKIDRQGMVLVGLMLLAVMVGCLVSVVVGRGISRPVVRIADAIERITQGDYDVEISATEQRDEIGVIAGAAVSLRESARRKARREAEANSQRESAEAARLSEEEARRQAEHDEQQLVIGALAEGMERLADGDLTHRIEAAFADRYRKLQDNFNRAMERLQDTIMAIAASTREVANAASEISTSTTDLSQRTEEQAASLEQTSASMEQICATVRKNAEDAQQANQFAGGTREIADRGGQVVAEAVNAMSRIEGSSHKISDIIGVIDEIARQTNLLALNAAVEAARAGEAGRGFAVVASEVRSLAQRSAQAAKDIKDLISKSTNQVQDGVKLVSRTGASLTEIVESIRRVATIVSDIAAASTEQATGLDQINKALTQIDELTQQNSALVEENAATAKTLEQQSMAMNERVDFFHLDDAATGTPGPTVARPMRAARPSAPVRRVHPG
jgi:methyl-accepting chemotaxis protein